MNCVYPNRWKGKFEEFSEIELDALIEHAPSCPAHAQLVDHYLSFGRAILDVAFDLRLETFDEPPDEIGAVNPTANFLKKIRSLVPMFPSPEYAMASDEQQTGWSEDEQTYLSGRLKCKRRRSVDGDNLLLLQSNDAASANRLVLVGEKSADLTLALLSGNNPIHPGYVSVLNFGASESPTVLFTDEILTPINLAELDPELIRTSIARVDETSELLAWRELVHSIERDGALQEVIRQALSDQLDNAHIE